MKKTKNIQLNLLGIGGLIIIGLVSFIGLAMGSGTDDYISTDEIISSNKQNPKEIIYKKDTIPQGEFKFEIYFAEHNGRMTNRTCNIKIKGNRIMVTQDETTNLTGGKIIIQGIVLRHKSGKWIIGEKIEDANAQEIGGCTELPIIDFEKKLFEWC